MDEKQKERTSAKSFITGVVIGGLIGTAAALLFAPKAGRELRKDIESQASIVLDKTGEMKETVVQKGLN